MSEATSQPLPDACLASFFAGTPPVLYDFFSTLGHGDPATIFPRSPQPDLGTFSPIA